MGNESIKTAAREHGLDFFAHGANDFFAKITRTGTQAPAVDVVAHPWYEMPTNVLNANLAAVAKVLDAAR